VKESKASWKPDASLPKLNPKQAVRVGTSFHFTTNQAMPVALGFAKLGKHGKYGKTKVLAVKAKKGLNVVDFGGRVSKSVKLTAGKYRVVLLAQNATGDKSAGHTLHFTIK
jgi:hypothetical protein